MMLLLPVFQTALVLLLSRASAFLVAKQTEKPNETTSELNHSVYICQNLLSSSYYPCYSAFELTTLQ